MKKLFLGLIALGSMSLMAVELESQDGRVCEVVRGTPLSSADKKCPINYACLPNKPLSSKLTSKLIYRVPGKCYRLVEITKEQANGATCGSSGLKLAAWATGPQPGQFYGCAKLEYIAGSK